MNLKKNDGMVGIDISIALIILLVLIPIITAMIYNVSRENINIKRKSQAINFAVNVIETAKGLEEENLQTSELEKRLCEYYADIAEVTNTTSNDGIIVLTKDSVSYNLKFEITEDKTAKVTVTYLLTGKEKSIELSTKIY